MQTLPKKPSLFRFHDYREYLLAQYRFLKKTRRGFSFRAFSELAGYASPNYLKRVLSGERRLNPEAIEKISIHFKLNEKERKFFLKLVAFNQAKNESEREFHAQALLKVKKFREFFPLMKEQYDYFGRWYIIAIREMSFLEGFQLDAQWISERLVPRVSLKEIEHAIEVLTKLGFYRKDPDGRLRVRSQSIATDSSVSRTAIRALHRSYLEIAKDVMESLPVEERNFQALTLSCGPEDYPRILEAFQRFGREVFEIVEGEKTKERVLQLNFQLFPLAQNPKPLK